MEDAIKKAKKEIKNIEEEQYKTTLYNPDFLKRMMNEVSKKIVGEEIVIKTILLVAIGGSSCKNINPTSNNLCLNASPGAGKDAVTNATLSFLIEEEKLFKRTKISPEAFTYWKFKDQKAGFTWDGKVVYVEDASNRLLNGDVFKTMSSGGSRATVVKDQKDVDILINGKPVMIITTAESEPKLELLRRFPLVYLNETTTQTEKIIDYISADAKKKAKNQEYSPDIVEAISLLKQYNVSIPFADVLAKYFKKYNAIIFRTHYRRILDYIRFSTIIYQFQRKKDEDDNLIATWRDWENVKESIALITRSKLGFNPTHKQKKVLDILQNGKWWSVPQIITKKPPYTEKGLYKALDTMTSLGILEMDFEPQDKRKDIKIFKISDSGLNIEFPSEKELIGSICTSGSDGSISSNSSGDKKKSYLPEPTELSEPRKHGHESIFHGCVVCGKTPCSDFNDKGQPVCEDHNITIEEEVLENASKK